MVSIGVLYIHLFMPGCSSLKEKRSRLKPLVSRLHKEFNLSVAEIDHQDIWQNAVIACALVSNDNAFTQGYLTRIPSWIEKHYPDLQIIDEHINLI